LQVKQKEIESEISVLIKKRKVRVLGVCLPRPCVLIVLLLLTYQSLEKQAGEAQAHMRDIFSGIEQQQGKEASQRS